MEQENKINEKKKFNKRMKYVDATPGLIQVPSIKYHAHSAGGEDEA